MTMATIRAFLLGTAFLSTSMAWVSPLHKKTDSVFHPMSSLSLSSSDETTLRVLGVCGGIGSGKSCACRFLVSNGKGCIAHLEADSIAHSVYHPDSNAVIEIASEFGSHILDENGAIDRKKLGEIVFADPDQMSKLEYIVWPHVKKEIQEKIDTLRREHKTGGVVVLEAAVLLDAGWEDLLDGLWVVTSSTPLALERLVQNRGFSQEEAQKRIEAQQQRRGIGNLPEEVKKGVVTKVIENEGSEEELQIKLQQALEDPTAWKWKGEGI